MYTMTPFEKKHFDLLNAFHDFENDFFAGTGWSTCKVDVGDEGDKFVLEADMPGVKREDIHIDINDDVLTIAAEWNTEKKNERQNGYIMNERRSGRASRSFTLENVKEDEISAEYKDGVLTLTMPKVTETRKSPRRIEIQ